jgi:phosphatidylglycerol:prolipoprotein diacylglycerol transferase
VHPQLFQFGHLVLPTYGFLVALGTILALLVCIHTARTLFLDTEKIWSVALLAIVTTLVGNKLLSIALAWHPSSSWALDWNGGGGIGIGIAAVASIAYAVYLRLPLRRSADAFAPGLAVGSSVISIGCLEAGCDYGTPTRLPWAVVFRSPVAGMSGTPLGVPLHPTQIYTSLVDFLLFALLLWLLHRPHHDGEIMGAWLFLGGLASFLLTLVRGEVGPLLAGLVPFTQVASAVMVLAGACLWLRYGQATQVSHLG